MPWSLPSQRHLRSSANHTDHQIIPYRDWIQRCTSHLLLLILGGTEQIQLRFNTLVARPHPRKRLAESLGIFKGFSSRFARSVHGDVSMHYEEWQVTSMPHCLPVRFSRNQELLCCQCVYSHFTMWWCTRYSVHSTHISLHVPTVSNVVVYERFRARCGERSPWRLLKKGRNVCLLTVVFSLLCVLLETVRCCRAQRKKDVSYKGVSVWPSLRCFWHVIVQITVL